jgi:drug/metabolite transporter (DMT)-like permease
MVILFRAATTVAVAIGDVFLYARSFEYFELAGIVAVIAGCILFALDHLHANAVGILWGIGYYFSLSFNTLYAKGVFNQYSNVSAWTKTFYCNCLALIPCIIISGLSENSTSLILVLGNLKPMGWLMVFLSCMIGLFLGATGNVCRNMLSPTGFDVAGNVNKFITVFVNQWVFDYSLTARSTLGACITLLGASVYSKSFGLGSWC